MKSKLELIVEQRRLDVAASKEAVPQTALVAAAAALEEELGAPLDLSDAIAKHHAVASGSSDTGGAEMFVAAEFKRASPSKGDIAVGLDVGDQARAYAAGGAGLVSVLTEPKWFKGSLDDLLTARRAVASGVESPRTGMRPLLLRKDFVIDEYQLFEARAYGADTVLLMLSILSPNELAALLAQSRALGMEPLVEVVNEEETLTALAAGAKVLGVNNRNLHTFTVDLQTTLRVVDVVRSHGGLAKPDGPGPGIASSSVTVTVTAVLALSGIKTREDVRVYERAGGVSGLLVGEALMRAPYPGAAIAALVRDGSGEAACSDGAGGFTAEGSAELAAPVRVKVCGINDVASALAAAEAGADFIGLIFVAKSVRSVDVAGAKDIVAAIRGFREREGRIDVALPKALAPCPSSSSSSLPPSSSSSSSSSCAPLSSAPWFEAWAGSFEAACDGQGRPLVVGVFMDQPVEEVNRVALEAGVDLIQLHSVETTGFEAQCALPCLRVVHVDADAKIADGVGAVAAKRTIGGPASMLLLDTSVKGGASGGTGKTFDWAIAKDLGLPLIMAGGLTAENVAKAVSQARPWGVDVASGVESVPGVKDQDKIRAFVRNAKSA